MKTARFGSLLAITIVAAACATATTTPGTDGGTTTSPSTASPGATGTTQTSPPAVVELLDFEYPLLSGGTLRGADLAGKDVAFWFWAPW